VLRRLAEGSRPLIQGQAGRFGPQRHTPEQHGSLIRSRTLGTGAPLAPRLAGANFTSTPVPPTTHKLPSCSNARPSGMLNDPALEWITTFGSNGPLPANWAGVNASRLLRPLLATQRFPAASKAIPVGFTSESAAVSTNAGAGDPDTASCAAVYR